MTTTNTEARIKVASKLLGKALAKLDKLDPELAKRLSEALSAEVESFRR